MAFPTCGGPRVLQLCRPGLQTPARSHALPVHEWCSPRVAQGTATIVYYERSKALAIDAVTSTGMGHLRTLVSGSPLLQSMSHLGTVQ
eukprot:1234853-Amphidinium_carterae.1